MLVSANPEADYLELADATLRSNLFTIKDETRIAIVKGVSKVKDQNYGNPAMSKRRKLQVSTIPWGDLLLRFNDSLKRQRQTGPARAMKNEQLDAWIHHVSNHIRTDPTEFEQMHANMMRTLMNMRHNTINNIRADPELKQQMRVNIMRTLKKLRSRGK